MTKPGEQLWRAEGISMGPAWSEDALLVTRPPSRFRPVRRGDVVVYELGGGLIAHRVVRIRRTRAGIRYPTQGDGSWSPDEIEIGPDAIRGIVVAVMMNGRTVKMKRIGNLGRWFLLRMKATLIWLVSSKTQFRS